ncbi:hypothetical protein BJV77DRAFT_350632 [Russula vinacea]|nr:hypothetical protein BJV77DRAFT_350632 [Russula vinacea]
MYHPRKDDINAPSRHFLDNIVVLSHNTIALVNPVDNTLELCRIDTATATLHILRTLDLPPIHNDLSLFRASSAVHSPSTIPPPAPRAALFYEDPARTITCIALHYTPAESAVSLDPGEWREPEEQARTLLVTRHSALLTLAAAAAAAQNAQAQRARTPWRTWSSSAARVLRLAGATGASHGFGTHATSYERLFLFGKTTPAASATTDTVTTITHLDFNSHRVSRPRTTSSSRAVHGCCCARLSGAGFNTLRGHWERGDCVGECGYDEESEIDFTVEELPYRQTRSTLLDDSDAYFGTDRIVFVRSMKVDQGSGVGFEGLVCNRVIVHSMMG